MIVPQLFIPYTSVREQSTVHCHRFRSAIFADADRRRMPALEMAERGPRGCGRRFAAHIF